MASLALADPVVGGRDLGHGAVRGRIVRMPRDQQPLLPGGVPDERPREGGGPLVGAQPAEAADRRSVRRSPSAGDELGVSGVGPVQRRAGQAGADQACGQLVRYSLQDDGSVSFARTAVGTRVTICAYQQFALPPLWQAITPVLWPSVRCALVEDAYRRSFHITLSTIAAHGQGCRPRRRLAPPPRSGTPSPGWPSR